MNLDNFTLNSDFTVYIGENGSGKSEILNQISQKSVKNGQNVIAIAHCIHDKFDISLTEKKNFDFLGARFGSKMTQISFKEILKTFYKKNRVNFSLSAIFEYVGYESTVGVSFDLDYQNINSLRVELSKSKNSQIRHSNVENLLIEYARRRNHDSLIWVDFKHREISTLVDSRFIELLRYERELTALGIIKNVNYYLIKNNEIFNLENASSGELYQLSTMFYIASKIEKNSIILIDEPENSLHPKWQKEYISRLYELFSLYKPKFVLATHSPLLVSDIILNQCDVMFRNYHSMSTDIYKYNGRFFDKISPASSNLENVLWDMFNVITPENNFLSNLLVGLMNDVNDRRVSKNDALDLIINLKKSTTDSRQKSVLNDVINLIEEKL